MVSLPPRTFDRILHEVIDELPSPFRELLDVVPVVVDPEPAEDMLEEFPDDELTGLYVGPPMHLWNASDAPPETAVIYIFQHPLERTCDSRAELAEQIRITLLHELGHCVGFDDDGLDRIGLG